MGVVNLDEILVLLCFVVECLIGLGYEVDYKYFWLVG